MPFKKRNTEYYFEAVQLFDNFRREHAAGYVALCPLCAAKFKELVKRDDSSQNLHPWNSKENQRLEKWKSHIDDKSCSVKLNIEYNQSSYALKFVEQHWMDVQTILEAEQEEIGLNISV